MNLREISIEKIVTEAMRKDELTKNSIVMEIDVYSLSTKDSTLEAFPRENV